MAPKQQGKRRTTPVLTFRRAIWPAVTRIFRGKGLPHPTGAEEPLTFPKHGRYVNVTPGRFV